MEENAKKEYRLFALAINDKSVETAAKARFCRATGRYVLVYTAEDAPDGGVEIGADDLNRLSQGEQNWLNDCNFLIMAEYARAHEGEIAGSMSKMLDELESALKAEKEKRKEG